jgi:hypothetical protein
MTNDYVSITALEAELIGRIKNLMGKEKSVTFFADDIFLPMWKARADHKEYDYTRFRKMMVSNMKYVAIKLLMLKRYNIRRVSPLGAGRKAVYSVEKFSLPHGGGSRR